MGLIDKCGVRGDATLCVVIFYDSNNERYFTQLFLHRLHLQFVRLMCHRCQPYMYKFLMISLRRLKFIFGHLVGIR